MAKKKVITNKMQEVAADILTTFDINMYFEQSELTLEERYWKAYIGVNGERIHIGTFSNKDNAIYARELYEEKYHKEYNRDEKDLRNGTR